MNKYTEIKADDVNILIDSQRMGKWMDSMKIRQTTKDKWTLLYFI